jgi:hypothetical protein
MAEVRSFGKGQFDAKTAPKIRKALTAPERQPPTMPSDFFADLHTIAKTPHQQRTSTSTSTSTARTARTATTTTTTINDHQPPVTSPLWRVLNRSSFSFDVKSSS